MAPAVMFWGGAQWTAHATAPALQAHAPQTHAPQALTLRPYDPVTQAISELVARDAPDRAAVSALFVLYNGLLATFGLALRDVARSRACGRRRDHPGVRAGNRVLLLAALGVLLLAAPMDPAGGPRTPVGLAHTFIAGLMAVVAAAAALDAGRWLHDEPGMAVYARLSQATVGLMILFGLLTLAGSWLEMLGLMERLLTGAFEVWMGVVAVGLYRAVGGSKQ
jgi:hypothetical protein